MGGILARVMGAVGRGARAYGNRVKKNLLEDESETDKKKQPASKGPATAGPVATVASPPEKFEVGKVTGDIERMLRKRRYPWANSQTR